MRHFPMQRSDEQLRYQLLDSYTDQTPIYPDGSAVVALKGELYRRGHSRTDIVTIALASLLRRPRRG